MAETQVFLLASPRCRAQCCSPGSSLLPLQELQAPRLQAVPHVLPVHPLHSTLVPPATKTETLSTPSASPSVRHLLFRPWHARSVISIFYAAAQITFAGRGSAPCTLPFCITSCGFPEKPLCSSPYAFDRSLLAENRRCGKKGDSRAEDERSVHASRQPVQDMVRTPHAMGRKAGRAGCHCKAPQHRGVCHRAFARARQNVPVVTTDKSEVAQLHLTFSICSFYHTIYHSTHSAGCTEVRTPAVFLTRKVHRRVQVRKAEVPP